MQHRGEKWHAAVAKSTFGSENAQKLTVSEHFLKFSCRKMARGCGAKHICKSKCTKHLIVGAIFEFRCSKMARRCGAKHICKSKCTKHLIVGAIFEVPMFKNGTPLWREAHF